MKFLVLLIPFALIVGWLLVRARRRAIRRRSALARPFPEAWMDLLKRNVPLYGRLPAELRDELHRHINVFLVEKRFFGRGGMEITDEVRVTIAAQACLLLLNRHATYFPGLHSIFVFPGAYRVTGIADDDTEIVGDEVRLGESWDAGPVVLSWDAVLRGAEITGDGYNVVLHEFAHQLDQEYGAADGAPDLGELHRYEAWSGVLGEEFQRLQDATSRNRRTVLDDYGAENPAEFFAVATETFFEKGRQLRRQHEALYEQLRSFYQVDPAEWG